ncbi:MAG: hypothetical protein JO301_09655 [Chitinophagaceae bacterium]|nr:hypothetical protein [Chitinophagaceae bacterium]
MRHRSEPSFLKKLALVAAVVSGNIFLVMFLIEFFFHVEAIWDSQLYLYLGPAIIIVLTLLWQFAFRAGRKADPDIDRRIWYLGTVMVRYGLATVLMIYAFAKFTDGQFTHNFSDSEVTISQASGLKLAWAFFGYSSVYSSFIGGMQIICALLLFFRRTVLLASVILLPVLANIFLMDLTHHINAEDIAGSLLYMTLVLFLQYYHRLKSFFITHERIEALDTHAPVQIGGRWKPWLKILTVAACIGYPVYDNVTDMYEAVTQLPIRGAWIATNEYRGRDSLVEQVQLDTVHTRLYVEDYLQARMYAGGKRQFGSLKPDSAGAGLTLDFMDKEIKPIKGAYHMISPDRFEFTGRQGTDSVRYVFRRRESKSKK